MKNHQDLFGKVWGRNGMEQMLCIESNELITFHSKDGCYEINMKYEDETMTITALQQYKGKYALSLSEDKLIIKSDNDSELAGEWKLLHKDHIDPLDITDQQSINNGIDNSCWMSHIDSRRSLKDMCIVGTHDSAAYKMDKSFFAPWTLTQEADFSQQLNDGIRAFDLRLSENMNFFHGKFYLSQNLRSCLDAMVSFLNQHPSETIIVTVKPENCDDFNKFISNFKKILTDYEAYFYTKSYVPTLGEVRKKIVLLRRFQLDCGIAMLPWRDNTTFQVRDSRNLIIQVQDRYNTSYDDKLKCILEDIANARDRQSLMYITHFSLQSSGNSIKYVANKVQNMFIDSGAWRDFGNRRYIGIYPFDYYNRSLIAWFIYTNFK